MGTRVFPPRDQIQSEEFGFRWRRDGTGKGDGDEQQRRRRSSLRLLQMRHLHSLYAFSFCASPSWLPKRFSWYYGLGELLMILLFGPSFFFSVNLMKFVVGCAKSVLCLAVSYFGIWCCLFELEERDCRFSWLHGKSFWQDMMRCIGVERNFLFSFRIERFIWVTSSEFLFHLFG